MNNKSKQRRNLLAGGVATAVLAAVPLQNHAQSKKYKNKTGSNKNTKPTQFKAVPIPEQTFASMVYGRLGYGITPGEFDQNSWLSLGSDDEQRLQNFVDQQLAGGVDVDVDARIADAGNFATLDKTLPEMWLDHRINPGSGVDSYNRPIYEIKRLKFTRAAYSLFPLRERLADFWHDHFSLNGDDTYARSTMTSWDRDVIRQHMLGNFKDFVTATAQHPAMLYYLDNYENTKSAPNENYARELIELHTLGVENYFGLAQQNMVPTIDVNESGGAWPTGPGPGQSTIQQFYVDADVYEAGRCLTGWHVDDDGATGTGMFLFNSNQHDRNQKAVLGGGMINFFADQGIDDGYNLFELLAYHPGTAKHIAGKLARFFISDTPPQTVIDDVEAVFYANRTAPNQLELVFKALFNHSDFIDPSHWQSKLKRPFDSVVSAMRVCQTDFTVKPDDSNSNTLEYRMDDTGHFPFEWQSPDGYPMKSSYWMSSTALIQTWKTVDWIIDEENSGLYITPLLVRTVAEFENTPTELTPENMLIFWMTEIFDHVPTGGWVGDQVFESIIPFLVQQPENSSYPPWQRTLTIPFDDLVENDWPYRWHERLRGMVSLILASPYFMQR